MWKWKDNNWLLLQVITANLNKYVLMPHPHPRLANGPGSPGSEKREKTTLSQHSRENFPPCHCHQR